MLVGYTQGLHLHNYGVMYQPHQTRDLVVHRTSAIIMYGAREVKDLGD